MQHIFTSVSLILFLFSTAAINAQNESIIVVNGGLFGSTTNYANPTIQNLSPTASPADSLGTIGTNSIQDILIDSNFAYVAAQDSIVKYDWTTRTRIAAAAFGGVSTVKLALYQDKLLVGNFYLPFGSTAPYPNNLRIFDANTMAFIDSVPAITKPTEDILVIGDYAYIAQNHVKTSGFGDTLGYLTIYDIQADTIVSNDTLGLAGEEIGRLVTKNGVLYALNGASNTISEYAIATGAATTYAAGVDLKPASYGPTAFEGNGVWYFPYDSGIGSYDLTTGTAVSHHVTYLGNSAFAFNPANNTFCVATTNFGNQTVNTGIVYDLQGDSLYSFDVGFSPEALVVVSNTLLNTVIVPAEGEELNYTLAPNPTSNQLTVSLDKAQLVRLEVINQIGQSMLVEQSYQKETTLDVSHLPTGTYWMVVIDEKGRMRTQGFVKQ
ncbi:MAG: T9SS type A sorting domain-containing protein [Aureispira sp.]